MSYFVKLRHPHFMLNKFAMPIRCSYKSTTLLEFDPNSRPISRADHSQSDSALTIRSYHVGLNILSDKNSEYILFRSLI